MPSPRHSVKSAASHEDVVEASQAAAHRHALRRLVASACEGLDLRALLLDPPLVSLVAQLDHVLPARARELEARGEAAGVSVDVLVAEARRELFELGPVGPLLDDDDVEEIQILGHDHVLAIHDHKQIATELAFTSEDAVRRTIHRLCASAGAPIEPSARFVERRLPSGARLHAALAPEAAGAHVVTLKKPHARTSNFDELVRTGALSRGIAMMLSAVVRHRANVLLVGSPSSGVGDVIQAHVSAGAPDERVVVLDNDGRWMTRSMRHAVTIDVGGSDEVRREAVRLAMHIVPDRLVVPSLTRGLASAVVGMVSEGLGGIIACSPAPTLRHALSRLPVELGVEHPTLSASTAGDWLANTFDLLLEVARLDDGRPRIVRIAELTSQSGTLEARDVFVFSPSDPTAGPEGHFHPTGHIPSVVEELRDREGGRERAICERARR